MKLAFIVQRYGREILGGSETLARQLAERLSRRHEITVLTTTAKDYITWKNEYDPGEEKLRGVRILRFPVVGERDIDDFNKYSEEIYRGQPSREQELEWLERQGPVTPEFVDYLKKEHHRFDLLVFFTYLYYPTYHGLQVAPEKSVLVPTAHDEPPLKLGIFREMFQLPGAFLFNTEAEELLVLERFPVHKKMRETIGMGMELLDQPDPAIFRKRHNVSAKYFLYAGRIDGGKGLEELFRYFTFFKEEHPATGNLQLILIGKLGMKMPDDKSTRYVGFVDEAEKLSAMAGAVAVLQPSKMESLSIVTLEAFSVGTPVIVNAASRVLVDHCRKANAGFYYNDFEEFEEVVGLLLSDRNLARSLGKNGQRYVKENYGWQKLLTKYELAFRSYARPAKEPRRRERGPRDEPVARSRERVEARPEPQAEPREPTKRDEDRPEEERPVAEAVSEASDPDATVRIVDASEPAEAAGPELAADTEPVEPPAPVPDAGVEPAGAPDAQQPSEGGVEPADDAAPAEPQPPSEEPPSGDVAHLPSFFRSTLPPRKAEPATAAKPPTPRTPPPPPPPAVEGELPEFYRRKTKPEETRRDVSADPETKPSQKPPPPE